MHAAAAGVLRSSSRALDRAAPVADAADMRHSLFAHLALHFGSHPENLATEALGFILQKSAPARTAVADVLRGCGCDLPAELTYATQVTGVDEARPDLVARDPQGGEPLLIEVKFWAGLTDNQPVMYLRRLNPGGTLLVVAPEARLALLWGELRRRCEDVGEGLSEATTNAGITAATVSGRRLVLLSWRALLASIHRAVDAAGDRKTSEDVAQLDGLCERMDTEAFLPVAAEELTSGVYRRVLQFNAIVDDAVGRLVDRGVASTKGLRATAGAGYYGRFMHLRGVGVFLICDVRKWMKYAATPVWLSVYGTRWTESNAEAAQRVVAPYESAKPGRVFKATDGFPAVAIEVPSGVEREVVLDRVIAQVEEVGKIIASLAIEEPSASAALPSET